jgi:hypothetical protein
MWAAFADTMAIGVTALSSRYEIAPCRSGEPTHPPIQQYFHGGVVGGPDQIWH